MVEDMDVVGADSEDDPLLDPALELSSRNRLQQHLLRMSRASLAAAATVRVVGPMLLVARGASDWVGCDEDDEGVPHLVRVRRGTSLK